MNSPTNKTSHLILLWKKNSNNPIFIRDGSLADNGIVEDVTLQLVVLKHPTKNEIAEYRRKLSYVTHTVFATYIEYNKIKEVEKQDITSWELYNDSQYDPIKKKRCYQGLYQHNNLNQWFLCTPYPLCSVRGGVDNKPYSSLDEVRIVMKNISKQWYAAIDKLIDEYELPHNIINIIQEHDNGQILPRL